MCKEKYYLLYIMHDVLIPYKYSRLAHFTSLFILKNAYTLYTNGFTFIGILSYLCYIFTNLHWYRLRTNGYIRNIDISIVMSIFISSLYQAYNYDCYLQYIYGTTITISIFAFNEALNSISLYKPEFSTMDEKKKHYTYLRCVLIHTFFLHIFQMELGGYVTTCNHYINN